MTDNHKNFSLNQAVVLCGGLGTRLRPLTDSTPKPMVNVNGLPFLHHLLFQLSEQGMKEFVLLTGYLGQQIYDYFGDGSKWGWNIKYSKGPVDWDTGRRLWEAKEEFDDHFLLLYSDNFATFNLNKLSTFHKNNNYDMTLSLAEKDKGNIELSTEGKVLAYDKDRKLKNIKHVEIGYTVINKSLTFQLFKDPDVNFSEIISKAIKKMNVGGFIVKDGYKSISDPERLKLTQDFLDPKKIILIDRDGVINKRAPKGEYIGDWESFCFIEKTFEAMSVLAKKGYKFIVISNQAGVARGMIQIDSLEDLTKRMISKFKQNSIEILDCYICPHHWEEKCDCRKPNSKLFEQASKDFSFRLDQSIYIGDDSRDCQAAYNANCKSIFIGENQDLLKLTNLEKPLGVFDDLVKALPLIETFYNKISGGNS